MLKKSLVMLIAVGMVLSSWPTELVYATCWTSKTVIESTVPCANCDNGTCPGQTHAQVQYKTCTVAATNVAGKTECYEFTGYNDSTRVGYMHTCTNNWNASALATLGLTYAACGTVYFTPTAGLTCWLCALAWGGRALAVGECGFMTACAKDDDIKAAMYRTCIFSHFGGDNCQQGG